jgi:hypothetical protein
LPSILKKLDGVINNIFSIGLKGNKTTITSTDSGLSVDNNIDVGNHKIKTTATPTDVDDVVTLSYVTQHTNNCSRIYYQNVTGNTIIPQSDHKINGPCIVKNVVVDVLNSYDENASLVISLGGTVLAEESTVNLNHVGQYFNSTFHTLTSTGDLNVTINNATTVGTIRVYIEYISI